MSNEAFGKHMVWTVDPRTKSEIGIGYSSLVEAQAEASKLEQVGYKILRISPTPAYGAPYSIPLDNPQGFIDAVRPFLLRE